MIRRHFIYGYRDPMLFAAVGIAVSVLSFAVALVAALAS